MRQRSLFLMICMIVQAYSLENKNITTYNPEELLLKIFNFNTTITPRQTKPFGIKFEDDVDSQTDNGSNSYQPIIFDEEIKQNGLFKFEEDPNINTVPDYIDYTTYTDSQKLIFQDDNKIEEFKPTKKKRIKKPTNQGISSQIQQYPGSYPNLPESPSEPYLSTKKEPHNHSVKFEDGPVTNNNDGKPNIHETNNGSFAFQNNNSVVELKPPKKKRRRRRRKPRYQNAGYPGLPYPNQAYLGHYPNGPLQGYPSLYPGSIPPGYANQDPNGLQGYPSPSVNPQGYPQQYPDYSQGIPGQTAGQQPHLYPGNPSGQYYRPPRRRRKQSFASEALTAVTSALTSIALYDDYQCVPRLLCEAAGGGALGSSNVLQNISGLQPLLTLLAAYNGISSSPLFIFGRAVFLGMTAKGNLGSCRYAYPQCPTDPEQLVHYLNNHNGGFFRFFNSPQPNNPQYGQQNVEQFYNHLSQNFGLQQPLNEQNYGIHQPNAPNQLNNGIYSNTVAQQNNGIPNIPNQQHYGIYQPNFPPANVNNPNFQANFQGYGFPGASPYGPQSYGLQNYGPTYQYNKEAKKSEIEKRILNGPVFEHVRDDFDNNDSPKWLSPESSHSVHKEFKNYRGGRDLKFPGEEAIQEFNTPALPDANTRKGKGFSFPNYQNNIKYVNYNTIPSTTPVYNKYGLYHHNYNLNNNSPNDQYQHNNFNNNNDDVNINNYNNQNGGGEGLETVYIVRGNGDPNHPEIVKLKPGEKLQ